MFSFGCRELVAGVHGAVEAGAEAGAEAGVAVPGGADPGKLLSCFFRQLVAGVHGGAEAGAEASVALKPVLNPLSPNSYRPEVGVTVYM